MQPRTLLQLNTSPYCAFTANSLVRSQYSSALDVLPPMLLCHQRRTLLLHGRWPGVPLSLSFPMVDALVLLSLSKIPTSNSMHIKNIRIYIVPNFNTKTDSVFEPNSIPTLPIPRSKWTFRVTKFYAYRTLQSVAFPLGFDLEWTLPLS